jgi:NitT/TauT family transport system substrate-binding protein
MRYLRTTLSVAWIPLLLVACHAAPATAPGPAPAAVAAPASDAATAAASPPLETVRITFASHSAAYAPFHIAIDKGYFAEEGLAVDALNAGGGVGTPALLAGEVQYSTSAASSFSAILKGAPLKIVYTNVDRPGYELWSTTPDVRTVEDLVGKSIGVLTRGDSSEVAVRLLLEQRGVDASGVAFTALGGSAQSLAAAQAGAVAAVTLGTAEAVQLAQGIPHGHQLANLKRELRMLYMGLTTTDRELQEHRERVRRVLRATLRGREYYQAFRDETLQIMGQHNDSPREANAADYDDVLRSLTEDGSLPVDVQRRDAAVRAELNGVEAIPPLDQMYDYSLVQDVYRELRADAWRPER